MGRRCAFLHCYSIPLAQSGSLMLNVQPLLTLAQGGHSTKRRDDMLAWQHRYQAVWEQEKLFEANAPADGALESLWAW